MNQAHKTTIKECQTSNVFKQWVRDKATLCMNKNSDIVLYFLRTLLVYVLKVFSNHAHSPKKRKFVSTMILSNGMTL